MRDIIMGAANELGIGAHIFIKEFADSIEPVVTIAYAPRAVQSRISWPLLMDTKQLKIVLSDMARMARCT